MVINQNDILLTSFSYATMPKSTKGHNFVRFTFKLLHTKYLSSGPYSFREDLSFSHFKSMGANEPRRMANLVPKCMVGKISVGDHLTLLHTKYLTSGPYTV